MQVRIQQGKVFLLEQRNSNNFVHVYNLPVAALEKRRPALSSDSSASFDLVDLGPEISRQMHSLPGQVQSMSDMLYVPRLFTTNIPVTMFDISSSTGISSLGYVMQYPFDPCDGVIPPQSPVASFTIPCRDDTSQQLVNIGTTGRRMVWMEHELETGRNRVMKFQLAEYNWENCDELGSVLGLLLPPEPNLPFTLNTCNSLAFDEVSGRLCLAFYDGGLHVLDFA